eukprot:TRINITY_DN2608_c0_g1_i6.p2 TRINITY_DN2608_c0_g1~~TRINITY_DN2608_c0_g1_i6.p2  ORF type:complete len:133 (-),score=18.20 TRINITY_DN2608_c0_g1_i6:277-675(-)
MHNLLRALIYLEHKNLMHRDLKPENILIRNEDDITDVIVADFGLSEYQGQQPYLFKKCGTPGYISPEILLGLEQSPKVDIFSAGVILYIILTGFAVFYGDNYIDILQKIKTVRLILILRNQIVIFPLKDKIY